MASISKRERKRSDGTTLVDYRVSYKDASGKWKRPSFESKREAEKFAATIGAEVIAGRHVANSDSISVADAAAAWLEACEKTGVGGREAVEPHTLRDYKQFVRDHINPFLGAIRLNKLTPRRVVEYRDDELLKTRSRNTAKVALKHLSAICKFAIPKGWLAVNPCDSVSVINSKRHKKLVMPPSHGDIEKLLSVARKWLDEPDQVNEMARDPIMPYEDKPGRWRVRWTASKGVRQAKIFHDLEQARAFAETMARLQVKTRDIVTRRAALLGYGVCAFAVETGLRLSEIRGANRANLDLEQKTYRVVERADENGILGTTKSFSSRRTVDIPDYLIPVLQELMDLNPGIELLFPSADGTVFSASNFYRRYWIPLLKAVGLAWDAEEEDEDGTVAKFGFHFLRHYHASRCLENGMDMKELSVHMGHSTVQITMDIYTHIFEDIQAEKKRREKALARPVALA